LPDKNIHGNFGLVIYFHVPKRKCMGEIDIEKEKV